MRIKFFWQVGISSSNYESIYGVVIYEIGMAWDFLKVQIHIEW